MVERQAHSPVGLVERGGNGHLRRIEYSPVLEHEKKKNFIDIILERTGKGFDSLPPIVAKTILIVEDLKNAEDGNTISVADKFRITGYLFWEIDGKFDLVKTHLGENAGPKWESLLNEVWDRQELRDLRRVAVKERRFLDKFIGDSKVGKNPEGILEIYRGQIQYLRKKGKNDEEILSERESILTKTNRFLKKDLLGKVLVKKKDNKRGKEISYELMLPEDRRERIISALIYLKKIKPQGHTLEESARFNLNLKKVEEVSIEHPEWKYPEVAEYLGLTIPQVRVARMVLIEAKRLQSAKHAREIKRDIKARAEEQAVVDIRNSNTELTYKEIGKVLKMPESRVQYYVKRALDKGTIRNKKLIYREQLKDKVRKKMAAHMENSPNEIFFRKPLEKEFNTSHSTLAKLFSELSSEFPGIKLALPGFPQSS